MRKLPVLFLILLPFISLGQPDTTQKITANRYNSAAQQQKPYVILISADGFRHDFAKKYKAVHLQELANAGVAADAMIPAYPSLTFPNHYTIVTGLYPSHHGLVDNTFYDAQRKALYRIGNRKVVEDGSWYGGTPLWVLAEKQQLLSASFYWVGSEADIQGVRPTYYYRYNEAIPIDQRIQAVKDWLTLPEAQRPHLVTFYLPEVDHEAHVFGPDSKQASAAVHFVDESIGKLVRMTDSLQLPVNFIFVSDHGMANIDTVNAVPLPPAADTSRFFIPYSDVLLHLYADEKKYIDPAYKALKQQAKEFDVYLPNETPAHWHYTTTDDRYNRIGDILLAPHFPRIFNITGRKMIPGRHGFDNAMRDMHAVFYAWGPAFKEGVKIPAFENVHVYPLVAKILGLHISETIDGDVKVLEGTLK